MGSITEVAIWLVEVMALKTAFSSPIPGDKLKNPMALKLQIPLDQIMPETAAFYRTHLGHSENAVTLAVGLIRKAAALEKGGI